MQRKLTHKQLSAAHRLAHGESESKIEIDLDISRETLWRWKKIPAFAAEYQREHEQVIREESEEKRNARQKEREETRYRFQHLAEASISALWEEMHNRGKGAKRLEAALAVFKLLGMDRVDALGARLLAMEESDQKIAANSSLSAASTACIDTSLPSAVSDVTP